MQLHGKISDKLRKLFAAGDPAWSPQRPASPTKAEPLPKGVKGEKLGGRGKHREK